MVSTELVQGGWILFLEKTIAVSPNRMEARLTIDVPEPGDLAPQLESCIESLKEHNITHGLCPESITNAMRAARARGTPVASVLVAKGTPPVPGENARIELLVQSGLAAGAMNEKDEHIDYHERGYLHLVTKGTPLARKIPATQGTPGRDVHGKDVAASAGKNILLTVTGNAVLSADGTQCHAGADGVAVIVNPTKIGVFEKYTVSGDVDLHTGNLNMQGALEITGWVRAGFHVSATGDLVIRGGIEPARVHTGASLAVSAGIVGGGDASVEAANNVTAQYIENAQVNAGGDITVESGIINSHVVAEGRVTAIRGNGSIIGGVVHATQGIEAKQVGSPAGVPTTVEVGIDCAARDSLIRMQRECALYERNRNKISRTLEILYRNHQSRPLRNEEKIAVNRLVRYRREAEAAREQINAILKQAEKTMATIKVQRTVYEGTTMFISGYRLHVADDITVPCEFKLNPEEGRIMF